MKVCGFESLPDEIITEILSRLPVVKSILICKSVCKTWKSLIDDDHFGKLQLSKSNTNPSLESSLILIELQGYGLTFERYIKRYLLNVDNCSLIEILVCLLVENKACCQLCMPISSHFDGLICLKNTYPNPGPVVICNPLISGDYVCLPVTSRAFSVVLGFDHSINKYKVVKISIDQISRLSGCEVFTIGKDTSWRNIGFQCSISPLICERGVCHKGSVYWLIRDKDNRYILEFNLSTEVFSLVSFPASMRSPRSHYRFEIMLQSLGEYLYLTEEESRVVHIWQIVKENSGSSKVAGYRKMKIQSPYLYAVISGLVYLNNNGDSFLLQTRGGREKGKSGEKTRTTGTNFTEYHPAAKKNQKMNRFTRLPNLQSMFSSGTVHAWSFKPSLISIRQAMRNNL